MITGSVWHPTRRLSPFGRSRSRTVSGIVCNCPVKGCDAVRSVLLDRARASCMTYLDDLSLRPGLAPVMQLVALSPTEAGQECLVFLSDGQEASRGAPEQTSFDGWPVVAHSRCVLHQCSVRAS